MGRAVLLHFCVSPELLCRVGRAAGDQRILEAVNACVRRKIALFNFLDNGQLLDLAARHIGFKAVVDIHHHNRTPWFVFTFWQR